MINDIKIKIQNKNYFIVKNSKYTRNFWELKNIGESISYSNLAQLIQNYNHFIINNKTSETLVTNLETIIFMYYTKNILENKNLSTEEQLFQIQKIIDDICSKPTLPGLYKIIETTILNDRTDLCQKIPTYCLNFFFSKYYQTNSSINPKIDSFYTQFTRSNIAKKSVQQLMQTLLTENHRN